MQGTMFPAGVWAAAQRNPISKKGDVVSEQNAEHSAIETGLKHSKKHVGTANKSLATNSSQGAKRNLTVDFRKFFD
ncbi:MAG: hypothetical protein V8Q79_02880 [Christensenellales bacterium]